MNDELEQKKADRFRFLNSVYEKTDGDEYATVVLWDVGAELGFSREYSERVVQYLVGENLIAWIASGGQIGITHFGVIQVERALSAPNEETQYFPAVVNIMNIGTVTGSQIQQAGGGSTFAGQLSATETAELARVVGELRTALAALPANGDLEAEVLTLEAQLRRREPNNTILRESLSTVRSVLEGMTGSLLASGLLLKLQPYLARF